MVRRRGGRMGKRWRKGKGRKYSRRFVKRSSKYSRPVHYFKEKCILPQIGASPGSTASGIITFHISDLLNFPSFKNMFDLYRLKGVKVQIMPKWTQQPLEGPGSVGASNIYLPNLYIAPNSDPYVPAPTSQSDLMNDDGAKVYRLGPRIINYYLRNPTPKIMDSANANPIPLTFSKRISPWLTTGGNSQTIDQSSVAHYGLRWYFDASNSGQANVACDVFATYYFQCKEQD